MKTERFRLVTVILAVCTGLLLITSGFYWYLQQKYAFDNAMPYQAPETAYYSRFVRPSANLVAVGIRDSRLPEPLNRSRLGYLYREYSRLRGITRVEVHSPDGHSTWRQGEPAIETNSVQPVADTAIDQVSALILLNIAPELSQAQKQTLATDIRDAGLSFADATGIRLFYAGNWYFNELVVRPLLEQFYASLKFLLPAVLLVFLILRYRAHRKKAGTARQ